MFSIITRHMILQKSFWFAAQKTFIIIIIMLKTAEYTSAGFFDE